MTGLDLGLPVRSIPLKSCCFSKDYDGLATFSRDLVGALCQRNEVNIAYAFSVYAPMSLLELPLQSPRIRYILCYQKMCSHSIPLQWVTFIWFLLSRAFVFGGGVAPPPHYGKMDLESLVRGWRTGCHFWRLLSDPYKKEVLNLVCTWITWAVLEKYWALGPTSPSALDIPLQLFWACRF